MKEKDPVFMMEDFEGQESYDGLAEIPQLSCSRELVEENQSVLSCGGAYIPRKASIPPFNKEYITLHLPNGLEEKILFKGHVPVCSSTSKEDLKRNIDELDGVDESLTDPLRKFFSSNLN